MHSENYATMAKVRNNEALQSYILTTAKYDFTIYEKRVLYKLVEIAQCQTQGLSFPKDCKKIDHDLFDFITIEIPYSSLLSKEEQSEQDEKKRNTNHALVRAALRALQTKIVEYEDKKTWESLSIIANPKYKKYSDKVSFIIDPRIWDVILNFSKGFRAIELKYTLWFSSVYTMRFYELLSRQTTLEHTFEELKEWFGLKDKYQGKDGIKDFMRRVIDPAQQELKDKAPFYFEYAPIKRNSRKTNAFKFHVVHKPELQEQIDHTKAKMQVSVRNFISREEKMYLMENFGFTEDGLRANNELFEEYVKWFDLLGDVAIIKAKMSELERKGSTIGSPQGYLINSLKKKLERVCKPSDRAIRTDIEEPTPKGSNRKPTAKELKEAKEAIAELSARTGIDFSRP